MRVAIISEELALQIDGQPVNNARKFKPVQCADGNWVISELEAQALNPEDYTYTEYVVT